MNSLLTNLLSLRRIEYLVIDHNLKILEMSLGVNRFIDIYEEVQLGKDIRLAFPELEGLEDVFEAILQGKQNNFELNGFNINEYRLSARQNPFLSSLVDTNKGVFHQVC